MTVELDWPIEVINRLSEEARQKGLSMEAYVLQVILQLQKSNDAAAVDEVEKRRKREEAAANIRELRKGITLGPDLTIRDLINEGRRF
jgi:hypothetical protein